jgi:hypothetical protein
VGQGKNRVAEPEKLEHHVEQIREGLTQVVSELDRRRHELMDWRLQLKRNKGPLLGIGGALALAGGVVAGIGLYRARHKPPVPLFRRRPRPPLVQQESVGHKVLSAGLAALIAVVAKAVAQRAVAWAQPPRELPA